MTWGKWRVSSLVAGCAVFNILLMAFLIMATLLADRFPPRQSLALSESDTLVGLTSDGNTLVTKSIPDSLHPSETQGPIRLWDISTGKERAVYLSEVPLYPTNESVRLSPDGQLLAVNAKDGSLKILETETGKIVSEFPFVDPKEEGLLIGGLTVFSADSQRMAYLTRQEGKEYANLWDRQTKNRRVLFARGVRSLGAFSPDGETLVTCSLRGQADQELVNSPFTTQIEFWNVERKELRHSFDQGGWIQQIMFTPDGTLIGVTSDNEARFIDKDTGRTIRLLPDIRSLAFFPNGQRFLTVNTSAMHIRCWDYATEKVQFEYRTYSVPQLVLPDGRSLVTRLPDGTVQFWDVPPRKPLWWVIAWTAFPVLFIAFQLVILIRFLQQAKLKTIELQSTPLA